MALDMKQISAGIDSFLDTKVSLLKPPHKLGILAAALLLPCVAFFFLVYSPKSTEIKNLTSQKTSLEEELRKLEKAAREIDKYRAEMREIEEKFKTASQLLPDQKEIPSLLTAISAQGAAAGLEFLSFKPLVEKPQQFYAEIPVDIVVYGPYHNVGVFLDSISKLPRIVVANDVNMGTPKQVGTEMMLTTKLQMTTYRFLDQQEQQKAQASAAGKAAKSPAKK
ncbi:MAG: type 4a pilus biogenesis protein PilO [Thermodesulfobacteriota bacterium]